MTDDDLIAVIRRRASEQSRPLIERAVATEAAGRLDTMRDALVEVLGLVEYAKGRGCDVNTLDLDRILRKALIP